jgi:AAA15 family ATPase/GTPase
MLIRFRVSNFRSLRDEQELSLVAALPEGRTDLVRVEGTGLDLLRVAGIYGANAAGKSNVLEALEFMSQAVLGSHRQWGPEQPIPREPFLLEPSMREEPSLFEADFLIEGVRYQYGFRLDDERVLEEWLHVYPKNRRQVWLNRNAAAFTFGRELKGSNRTIEALTRRNSLFLSVAAENNHQALLPIYSWLVSELRFASARNRAGRIPLQALEQDGKRMLDLLKLADLGIVDFEIQNPVVAVEERTTETDFLRQYFEVARQRLSSYPKLFLKHQAKSGQISLPVERESQGTRTWLALLDPLLDTLRNQGVLCIDELDASLHPHLAAEVIRIFQDPDRNPGGAQLIFNTHDTNLLGNLLSDQPILHRDQVWFVEKDNEGASHLYPLTDFKPRKAENLERGYLQGRYGAIPFISAQLQPENAEESPE